MAINIPILTEFSDAGLKSAQGAFNNFRSKVGEAEGAMGKFKAGSNAAFDAVKANAGAMALGAGAAIAGFAVKAIGDFQQLALEVDKFSDVTGLAAEEASRWIEVAGDMGIESGTVEAAINRMNREIDKGTDKFEALGIEIERTSGGAVDVNETFLNTIDALNKIEDPAKRARVAAELLGKGWTGMAELVETGSDKLRNSLDSVAGAKVIDENEIEKAKRLRELQDNLNDSIEGFALALGETLLPALVAVAGPLETLAQKIQKAAEEGYKASDGALVLLGKKLGLISRDQGDVNDKMQEAYEGYYSARRAAENLAVATDDLDNRLATLDSTLQTLKGNVDQREVWRNLQDALDNAGDAAIRAFAEKTPESLRRSEAALDQARIKAGKYIADLDTIPPERKTDFIARLDQANLDEIERILAYLSRPRVAGITVGVGETPSEVRGRSPRTPMLNSFPSFGITPTSTTSGGVTVNVAGSVVSERDLIETVRKGLVDAQRNGSGLVYSNS